MAKWELECIICHSVYERDVPRGWKVEELSCAVCQNMRCMTGIRAKRKRTQVGAE